MTFRADEGDEDSSTAASSSDDEQGEDDEDEGSATGSLLRSALTGKATFRSSSPSGMTNRNNNFNSSIFGKGESPFKSIKSSNPSLSLGSMSNTSTYSGSLLVKGAKQPTNDTKAAQLLPFSANSLLPLPQHKSSLPSEKPSPQKVEEIILLAMQKTNETVGGGGGLLTTVKPANNVHLLGIKSPSVSGASSLLQQLKSPASSVTSSATSNITINTSSANIGPPPVSLRTLIPVSASVCGINTSASNVSIGGGDRNNNLKRPLIQQHTQQSSPPTANVISLVLDVNSGSNSSGANGQRSTINFIEPSLPRPIGMRF